VNPRVRQWQAEFGEPSDFSMFNFMLDEEVDAIFGKYIEGPGHTCKRPRFELAMAEPSTYTGPATHGDTEALVFDVTHEAGGIDVTQKKPPGYAQLQHPDNFYDLYTTCNRDVGDQLWFDFCSRFPSMLDMRLGYVDGTGTCMFMAICAYVVNELFAGPEYGDIMFNFPAFHEHVWLWRQHVADGIQYNDRLWRIWQDSTMYEQFRMNELYSRANTFERLNNRNKFCEYGDLWLVVLALYEIGFPDPNSGDMYPFSLSLRVFTQALYKDADDNEVYRYDEEVVQPVSTTETHGEATVVCSFNEKNEGHFWFCKKIA